MKTYYFSVDFDQAGFTAENSSKALDEAEDCIKKGYYNICLVDEDDE
jgi:hypothetical protein